MKKKSELEEKALDLENKWKRALADYANLEKRLDREKDNFVKFANKTLLLRLIPIVDDLDLAQRHLRDQGLALVAGKFHELLKSEGLTEFSPLGETFNPDFMEAVEIVKGQKNKVIEVVFPGFKIEDKVLRPAKVKVGEGGKSSKKKL